MSEPKATESEHYNPVDVNISPNESLGVIFLGILSFILLIALLRSQRQVRQLLRTSGKSE